MKTSLAALGVFGGSPLFTEPLHVGRPNIGNRARLFQRLEDMLDRRWLTNDGPFVLDFESRLAELLGARHCVATCNATAALQLAIRGLGMTGEVIVPSFTFVAPVHALGWAGITPVFCDIGPDSHLIDPDRVEALITERTSGIVGVHVWGQSCDVALLSELAARHELSLLFDAAHALGSDRDRARSGDGHAEVFSFHATKIANAFEGGAVATDDGDLAARIRKWRNFGFTGIDHVEALGINAKMSEASAAMGLTSLESLDEFVAVNERHYRRYLAGLDGLPGVTLRAPAAMAGTNYHYVVVEIDSGRAGVTRDVALRVLTAEGVLARRYFYPGCHRLEPYLSVDPTTEDRLTNTHSVCERILQLPTGTAISESDIDEVCAILRFISANAAEISERLDRGGPGPA